MWDGLVSECEFLKLHDINKHLGLMYHITIPNDCFTE